MKRALPAFYAATATAIAVAAGVWIYNLGDDNDAPRENPGTINDINDIVTITPPPAALAPPATPLPPMSEEEQAERERRLATGPRTPALVAPPPALLDATILKGFCNYEGSNNALKLEVLNTTDEDGEPQTQLWFARHIWIHMFESQGRSGSKTRENDVINLNLPQQGIAVTYDSKKRLGHATMTPETFRENFNGMTEGRPYNDKWHCRFQPAPAESVRLIPRASLNNNGPQ